LLPKVAGLKEGRDPSLLGVCINLADQPWRIMSIGMRDWAHEF
jgi:hypothetical protein